MWKIPPWLLQMQETRVNPWVGKISWRRAWQPTLVLLPRESPGQKSLAGCRPEGHTEKTELKKLSSKETVVPEWKLPVPGFAVYMMDNQHLKQKGALQNSRLKYLFSSKRY